MAIMQSRRAFLRFSLLAVPAVVAASSLMPIRGIILPSEINIDEIVSILEGRLERGHQSRWDSERHVLIAAKYPGDSKYFRYGGYDVLNIKDLVA